MKRSNSQPLEEISMQVDYSFKILAFYYTCQNNPPPLPPPLPPNPSQYHYRVSNSSNRAIDFVCCDDLCHAYGFIETKKPMMIMVTIMKE